MNPPLSSTFASTFRPAAAAVLLVLFSASACTNNMGGDYKLRALLSGSASGDSNGSDDDSDGGETSNTTGAVLYISTVTVATGDDPELSLFFDNSRSTPTGAKITDYCDTGDKPCACKFTWQEINETTGTQIPVTRSVQTTVSTVQQSLANCPAPSVYASEIASGTSISLTILPTGANPNAGLFTIQTKAFTKEGSTATGSFADAQGRAFENILRYSCYEQFTRGMSITSKSQTLTTNPNSGEVAEGIMSTQFCLAKNSGGSASSGCETQLTAPSAEAYYYNLYIRNSAKGAINAGNSRFKCPLVRETIRSGASGGVSVQGDYFPLDQNFALALASSAEYTVGVEAFTRVGIDGDPVTGSTSCFSSGDDGGGDGTSTSGSLVSSCLGFALKPNTDGTCPSIQDSIGRTINTYRLRRFIALYPPRFDTDGKRVSETQSTDTIYVLDRPVSSSSADPTKPYTMRGPKPCPFALFDHRGVAREGYDTSEYPASTEKPGGMPQYIGTSSVLWAGLNPDGIQFPNQDISGQSCSATFPLLNSNRTIFSLATLNKANPVLDRKFIRPMQPWAPHYEEDTDFKACAPQASPVVDPPLHFSKDTSTGNVSWCAEVYPTQNPYVTSLDALNSTSEAYPGKVANFTSHVVKNSLSPACTATQPTVATSSSTQRPTEVPPSPKYPEPNASTFGSSLTGAGACGPDFDPADPYAMVAGTAYHPNYLGVDTAEVLDAGAPECNSSGTPDASGCYYCAHQTCDRSVVSAEWTKFPLLARAPVIESAIRSDSTYGCILTYDGGGTKTGKSSPSGGCCGASVKMKTGQDSPATDDFSNAHLEPGTDGTLCQTPSY